MGWRTSAGASRRTHNRLQAEHRRRLLGLGVAHVVPHTEQVKE